MKVRAREASGKTYDHCIIGSGPAGMTLALELERLDPAARILLLEFGSAEMGGKNVLDDTIEVENKLNHHSPYECTNKGLGGSSATWGGRCVMYDEVDFLPREVVGDGCTWDISILEDSLKYVPQVSRIFECGTGPFDLKDDPSMAHTRIAEGFVPGAVSDSVLERWSMPTRFGSRYRPHVMASKTIELLDDCMAQHFTEPEKDGCVKSMEILIGTGGERHLVSARNFIISAGTQETTRLLLKNPQLFEGVGGVPDSLGKYYQGHVSGKIASVVFHGDPLKTDYGFIQEADGTYVRRRFQFSAQKLCEENLLNTAIWLDNPLYFDPSHRSGVMSLMYLAMMAPVLGSKLAPPAIRYSVTKGKWYKIPSHLWNIFRGLPQSLTIPAVTFYKRYCLKRKLPGVFLHSPKNHYALHFHAEQEPCRENRMELAADGETLKIYYQLSDADIDSVIRCHGILDAYLRETGCGHLDYWFDRAALPEAIRAMSKDGIHQSGTTRMADSVAMGVVDRELRVFGTSNVYVCSGSVLPTSGQANPTFFTCVLAARLADHLCPR